MCDQIQDTQMVYVWLLLANRTSTISGLASVCHCLLILQNNCICNCHWFIVLNIFIHLPNSLKLIKGSRLFLLHNIKVHGILK